MSASWVKSRPNDFKYKECFWWANRERGRWCTFMLALFISYLSHRLLSLMSRELVNPGVSAWLHLSGRDDEAFINKGSEGRWHRLMDDSTLFCLTCKPLPLDVPGRTLACGALLRFNYQSAGIVPDCTVQREWHPCTPTMSASSLAPIRCIMTAAAWLMPFKGSNVSASCINGQ